MPVLQCCLLYSSTGREAIIGKVMLEHDMLNLECGSVGVCFGSLSSPLLVGGDW